MFLAKNIRYLRKLHNWSQDYVADKLGYKSYTTIQKWEMGTSEPPLKKLKELALLFDVNINDLANKDIEAPIAPSKKKGVSVNVLGRVAAGSPIEAVTDIIDTEEITEDLAMTGSFFGLQIQGDYMEPRMCSGDVVIVRQQDDAESGDIVIALVNGDDATCKRLRKYRDGIELISNNPAYQPMFFSNKEIVEKPVRIIGKVVELRGKF
ncbi:MAG: helix-turn-helix domain-containing protein [Lachnospiraceae bacterium]|nr:helix-turn-helix domain-containing protein [Lachnospiraceae bacterium]